MIEITAYQANDGSLHRTKDGAEARDKYETYQELLELMDSGDDYDSEEDNLVKLLSLLLSNGITSKRALEELKEGIEDI